MVYFLCLFGGKMPKKEIDRIQDYIFAQLSSLQFNYTTLSQEDKTDKLLELLINWIAFEMEKRKL